MNIPVEERKQIENEMLFRRANEKVGADLDKLDELHIEDGNPHLASSDQLQLKFKCECSDENCEERIDMRLSTYKKIHLDRSAFIIRLRHEVKPIEKVILTTKTYSIVRKNNITPEPRTEALFHNTTIDNSKHKS